jgi:hypothetical protein
MENGEAAPMPESREPSHAGSEGETAQPSYSAPEMETAKPSHAEPEMETAEPSYASPQTETAEASPPAPVPAERREEPVAFAEEKPVPMPATEPVATAPVQEHREPEAKERPGYLNGSNGLAHAEAVSDETSSEGSAPDTAGQTAAVVDVPKPRGSRRGWWQRR